MKKRTLLTTCLSFALVLALATSGFATPVWTSSVAPTLYEWDGGWTPKTPGPSVRDYPVFNDSTGTAIAGGTGTMLYTMNLTLNGSWDSKNDLSNPKASEWDYFHVQIRNGSTLVKDVTFNHFDNADGLTSLPQTVTIELPYDAGVYYFKAWGEVTAGSDAVKAGEDPNERWTFESANLTPTPLPAAVWMLGSGLLGIMGFKRARKNATV